MTTTARPVLVGTFPQIVPRLLSDRRDRETLAEYRSSGGYAPVAHAEALHELVDASGLRGRGGAGFPTGRKLRAVRGGRGSPVVVANGEEGEPASIKDRWLLRHRPHLVLDGMRIAARAIGADRAYVYLSDTAAARSVADALAELPDGVAGGVPMTVHRVAPSYVAGEETAAVRSINGGPALPMDKPPRPYESGIDSRPTLVSNVETLANLPWIARHGADDFRSMGTPECPGTFLLTLNGLTGHGLYEVPFGITLRDVLGWLGVDPSRVAALLMGGYYSGLLPADRHLDTALDYDGLARAGSGLGCGAISILGATHCPVGIAASVMGYFARWNSGQCGSCFNGTAAMSGVLRALAQHRARAGDLDRLRNWSADLPGRGACGTLDGAANLAATLLREFPEVVRKHLETACGRCASMNGQEAPFAIEGPVSCG